MNWTDVAAAIAVATFLAAIFMGIRIFYDLAKEVYCRR